MNPTTTVIWWCNSNVN